MYQDDEQKCKDGILSELCSSNIYYIDTLYCIDRYQIDRLDKCF